VEGALVGPQGRASGVRVKSIFEYRWGYVKIHKEFRLPANGLRVRELCPMTTMLAPNLSEYGYREGTTEEKGAPPFAFGSNRWGKLRAGQPSDPPLQTPFVPRSMIFVDPGVEGLEWFRGSDLSQWDLSLTGRRGQGQCRLELSTEPPGLALALSPFWSTNAVTTLTNGCAFDFYLAVPLLEGHAEKPWVHTSFNRNRGNWVSREEIQRWADQGYQTVCCRCSRRLATSRAGSSPIGGTPRSRCRTAVALPRFIVARARLISSWRTWSRPRRRWGACCIRRSCHILWLLLALPASGR